MGCDIHFFVERYSVDEYEGPKDIQEDRESKISGVLNKPREPRWITADEWNYIEEEGEMSYWENNRRLFYGTRNYYLFGILAGVRGDEDPISKPRGIPSDVCYAYRVALSRYGGDGHSASYFTLTELLNVDWSIYDENGISVFMETIEKMRKIDENTDNVRCLFFFDN